MRSPGCESSLVAGLLNALLMSTVFSLQIAGAEQGIANKNSRRLPGWRTNTQKRIIELDELQSGGPGKNGIPSINNPRFVAADRARRWLKPVEPVISVSLNGRTKAYPLQILIWHEIVNDRIGETAIAVTFCPLCYSAIVFDRTIDGRAYSFGVSGMLRHSDMVMYDRRTETLWQQLSGRAIVGDLVGKTLKQLPAQIISFEQFRKAYPDGLVLSRQTGFRRRYGENPYAGYDDIKRSPFLFRGKTDGRLKPMEKVIALTIGDRSKAYPYSISRRLQVINDKVESEPLVVFHDQGAVSALDAPVIAHSKQAGSTGVFSRRLDEKLLTFIRQNNTFVDQQTKSIWSITGRAIAGPLKGKQLTPIPHGNYFAFAWLVFKTNTEIYHRPEKTN